MTENYDSILHVLNMLLMLGVLVAIRKLRRRG